MSKTITVSEVIPAAAAEIYAAWLDSIAHAAMTGGGKATASPEIGAPYSAWDGYINGLNLALDPGERIEQTWRSTDFNPGDPDSTLTVLLEPAEQGTKVTLVHSGVPDQLADFADGWRQFYFEPMKSYFAALMAPIADPAAATDPASKPSPREKPAVRKSAAAKKPAAANPATGKKSAAKPAKKTAAKKPAAKGRAAAKKSAPRKSGTRKAGAKKTAAKRTAAKKPAARKSSSRKPTKKAAPRKAASRKPATRKPATRKAGRGSAAKRRGRR